MRELAILTFVTLDGVMQGPMSPQEDESGGFLHGGWAAPYYEEVMEQVRREAMSEPYDMLFGRKTYDMFAGRFTTAPAHDATAKMMNNARKYVVTSNNGALPWQNSVALTGDIATEIARLKAEDGPLLQVHGSGALIRFLLAQGLVDELRLWIFPVALGAGQKLFDVETEPANLKLRISEPNPNGVVMMVYRTE